MNSTSLLSRISSFVASNMSQSVYAMSQFSQAANSTTNVVANENNVNVINGIICGKSVCGKLDDKKDEHCMR